MTSDAEPPDSQRTTALSWGFWLERAPITVEVHVIPAQRPRLLSPDAGGQGHDDVGAQVVVVLGGAQQRPGLVRAAALAEQSGFRPSANPWELWTRS